MPARARTQPDLQPAGAAPGPPYYLAARTLYAGDPASGSAPVIAFAPGDRVYPDAVAANGYGPGDVRIPEWFAGHLQPPEPPPPPADLESGPAGD